MPFRLFMHGCNWLTLAVFRTVTVVAVLLALFVLAMRYWVLPDIERYHDRITQTLSAMIGNPASIGKIEGDWRGLQPHVHLSDVRIFDHDRQLALVLPSIDVRVSWLTLLTASVHLARLEIDRPELLIRRDSQGKLFVGGIPVSTQGGDGQLANWLLRQPHLVASNAVLVWADEQRDALPLVLQQVNVRIENSSGRHRFALHAVPPDDLATPLDVRGELIGEDANQLAQWRGQMFSQIDYTDVSAWKPWLNLPREFSQGRGAFRSWWGIEGGKLAQITADVNVYDVVMQLGDDVPQMAISEMRGRASWKSVDGGLEIATRNLAMRLQDGVELQPTDFDFHASQRTASADASNELRANQLQLESLVSLSNFLPLDASLRQQLYAYAPRGQVTNLNARWQGEVGHPKSFAIKGHFTDLALRQVSQLPGFSGLTAEVNGNEQSGTMRIDTRNLVVDAPDIMREAIHADTLTGQVQWQREQGELAIHASDIEVANQDLAGRVQADFKTQAGTLGMLDMDAKLSRGDARSAARYIPLIALNQAGGEWLNSALLAGHTEDLAVRIKANLSDFPLRDKPDAIFKIDGHVQDGILLFDRAWPRIEHISGLLSIGPGKLEITSPSATLMDASLSNVHVVIPDLLSPDLSLLIKGEAVASNAAFLQFIQQSPVHRYIDGATDHMNATGNGHLDISLDLPLSGHKKVKVQGLVKMQDSDIDLGIGAPLLRKVNGGIAFTESGMRVEKAQAEVLGGSATLDVQVDHAGTVAATAHGNVDLDTLRVAHPAPALNYLHGLVKWDADISIVHKTPKVIVTSDLQGVSSTLPLPLTKQANDTLPLRVEWSAQVNQTKQAAPKRVGKLRMPPQVVSVEERDVITAKLGSLLQAKFLRRSENGEMTIKYGIVDFGDQGAALADEKLRARPGIWLTGTIPVLSLQGWDGLTGGEDKPAAQVPLEGASLRLQKVTGYGMTVNDMQVDAIRRMNGLSAQVASNLITGELTWQHPSEEAGYTAHGKLTGHLRSVMWQSGEIASKAGTAPTSGSALRVHPGNLPALELDIDSFQFNGKKIGSVTVVGHPDGKDWWLRRLNIDNPDGSLLGEGLWHETEQGTAQSQIKLTLNISDAGKILARSGYPDTVKDGSGKLTAEMSWQGDPAQFNYATLNGSLSLDTGKGRFVKMDPGIGKLLSVLSLQALPKHITLDFHDVFSQGFQFDAIKGSAAIKSGVMDTQDLHIDGSSAKVTMKGNVNLNDATQNLRVKVLPTLGDSISLISAVVINPAVGVGALIANKVLGNPLDKLASFEYNISGTWSDPEVVKVGGGKVKVQQGAGNGNNVQR